MGIGAGVEAGMEMRMEEREREVAERWQGKKKGK